MYGLWRLSRWVRGVKLLPSEQSSTSKPPLKNESLDLTVFSDGRFFLDLLWLFGQKSIIGTKKPLFLTLFRIESNLWLQGLSHRIDRRFYSNINESWMTSSWESFGSKNTVIGLQTSRYLKRWFLWRLSEDDVIRYLLNVYLSQC